MRDSFAKLLKVQGSTDVSTAEVATPDTKCLCDAGLRSHVYGVLASSFCYPSQEFVGALLEGSHVLGVCWGISSILAPHCAAPLTDVGQWISSRQPRTILRQLSTDYARLFVAGTMRVLAPPYESVYANQGPFEGEYAGSPISAYRQSGLATQLGCGDLPDHISAEMEFMRRLANAEKEAAKADSHANRLTWVERQGDFLRNHLGWWVPLCMQKVSANAATPFYRLLADVTARFVRWDLGQHAAVFAPSIAMHGR